MDPIRLGQEFKADSPYVGHDVSIIAVRVHKFDSDPDLDAQGAWQVRIRDAKDNTIRTIATIKMSKTPLDTPTTSVFSFPTTTIQSGYKFTVEFAGTDQSPVIGLELVTVLGSTTINHADTEGVEYPECVPKSSFAR